MEKLQGKMGTALEVLVESAGLAVIQYLLLSACLSFARRGVFVLFFAVFVSLGARYLERMKQIGLGWAARYGLFGLCLAAECLAAWVFGYARMEFVLLR